MTLIIYSIGAKAEVFDVMESELWEVLAVIHKHWMEDEALTTWVIVHENGDTAAVVMRDLVERDVAHTIYAEGHREAHRCKYVLDAEGKYDFTEVTRIEIGHCWRSLRHMSPCIVV